MSSEIFRPDIDNFSRWWDGEGTNGGKTKPKFFYAHSLTGTSSIKGLNILNSPVQVFSVDSVSGSLTMDSITIDDSAGDTDDLGHNTDAFDVGSSSGVTISNANVQNQDDCLAVNSGTVSRPGREDVLVCSLQSCRILPSPVAPALEAMVFRSARWEAALTMTST